MVRKPVFRIVLVLSILAVAGIVALASAGHHGIVTTQNGRMAIATKAPSHVTPFTPPPSGLTEIAGNLNKYYPYGVYFCCYGYTISGPDSFLGTAYWDAVPFTPSADINAVEIETAVGWGEDGTEGVTLSLNEDNNGLPGNALATANITSLGIFGECCTLATAKNPHGIALKGGTQYWVVVSTSSEFDTTFDAWALNTTDMRDYPFAYYNSTNGVWGATEGVLPGYAVLGK